MAKMLRADLRAAGLPSTYEGNPYTAHATRRSFSTWLREAGVDIETRDRLMGHAAGSVGEKHYTAMTTAVLAKLRDALESIQLDPLERRGDRAADAGGWRGGFGPASRRSWCGFWCGSH
jgi:integrase